MKTNEQPPTLVSLITVVMDLHKMEEYERTVEQKERRFLQIAEDICNLKKKTRDMEIACAAEERDLRQFTAKVAEKRTELEVIKAQVALLKEQCAVKVVTVD